MKSTLLKIALLGELPLAGILLGVLALGPVACVTQTSVLGRLTWPVPPVSMRTGSVPASAAGTKVAFARYDDRGFKHIYTANADGTGLSRITRGAVIDDDPVWSPDGSQIALIRERTLHIVDADGSNLRRDSHRSKYNDDSNVSWSPDGKRIVYIRRPTRRYERTIRVMNADSGASVELLGGLYPVFSPEGGRIAFTTGGGLWTIDLATGSLTNVSPGGGSLAWSPDGSRIAVVAETSSKVFVTNADGSVSFVSKDFDTILVANTDGSGVLELVRASDTGFGAPAWSPDGSRIFFKDGLEGRVVSADGTDVRGICSSCSPLSWSPDGGRLVFVGGQKYSVDTVTVVNADGTGRRELGSGRTPSWSPDGRLILFETEHSFPRGFAVVRSDGSGESARASGGSYFPTTTPLMGPHGHLRRPAGSPLRRPLGRR